MNVIVLSIFLAGALVFYGFEAFGGVLLGGAIVVASFQILKWQVARAFRHPRRPPGVGGFFLKYYLRFLATLFVIFTVIYYGWVDPIAFLVGLSVVMVSMVCVGMEQAVRLIGKRER